METAASRRIAQKSDGSVDARRIENGTPEHDAGNAGRRVVDSHIVHCLNEAVLVQSEGVAGKRSGIGEGGEGLRPRRLNAEHETGAMKAWQSILIVRDQPLVRTRYLDRGTAIGRHRPEVATAVPGENIREGQVQPVGEAPQLLRIGGK